MHMQGGIDRRQLAPTALLGISPGLLFLCLLGLAGCAHQQQARLQSDDESEHDRYGVATIGEKTSVGNADAVPVSGVGLVEGLDGTGGDTPPDGYRTMLEDELKKTDPSNYKELLNSPHKDTAMVLVSAMIPPGAHPGDALDVEVTLPRDSHATSLRGGKLRACKLYNYDFAKNLDPSYTGSAGLLLGHPIADAKGPVLVGLAGADEDERQRQGRIWGGGRCRIEQALMLVMNSKEAFARNTALIADRVNETFQPSFVGNQAGAVATAKDKIAVYLRVPPQYKLNIPHYLRVVRLVPLQEVTESSGPGATGRSYRQRLTDDLLDPTRTVAAALRLEALGQRSAPLLRKGLESKHPLVRFCAAESLLYLGSPMGAQEAAQAALEQPLLRAFALTALASLDEAICQEKLSDLIGMGRDDETRYGAFRGLQTLDDQHPAVRGELLNNSFFLHRTAPGTAPLVHVSTTKRAEVVLLGEEPFLKAPFAFMAGEFAVTAGDKDTGCTISRIPLHRGPVRRQCSLKLEDVLRTMADLGAAYPEVVTFLQQADKCECLSCRVRFDAMPQAVSVYDLVQAGRQTGGDSELLPGGQDLGLTPNLYDNGMAAGPGQERQADGGKRREREEPSSARQTDQPGG